MWIGLNKKKKGKKDIIESKYNNILLRTMCCAKSC